MPSDHGVSTAELLTNAHSIACPSLPSIHGSKGASRLLNWVVALTEMAQRHLARAAGADVLVGGMVIDPQGRFCNDAAGGGQRAAEAARSLHT